MWIKVQMRWDSSGRERTRGADVSEERGGREGDRGRPIRLWLSVTLDSDFDRVITVTVTVTVSVP